MTSSMVLARLRNSRWWRLALVVFAVPAVLIGLLMMHVLSAEGPTDSARSSVMSNHTVDATSTHESGSTATAQSGSEVPVEQCGSLCAPSHEMLTMICALVFLGTLLLLFPHLVLHRWEGWRRLRNALVVMSGALALPRPPSLHDLSISRT